LYDDYIDFATKLGERYKLTNIQFGKEIRKLCPGVERKRKTANSPHETSRPWVLYFPDIKRCRQMFEETVKLKIKWED